ncbi:LPS export ABC transporter periplasmic protein LptC [Sphingomonas bacterium]|uniref:LPS export ABC transporter periplasmic protein LptC n=1 Tax=Sphingomonas bacterium TaxID=1895847 RepID=UPI00157604DB|nr:LPS export ABC transporter periplasmic protein LptC [Sphingomonas bacterium]
MSEAARRVRSARQVWALPGSAHDRLITTLKIGLPIGIGVLGAFLVTAPLTATGDVSFVLDKHKVDVAHERLRIQAAQYRGEDGKGQPFTLDAKSAVQKSSAEPVVQIAGLAAGIRLADGPARLIANNGRYDMGTQQVAIEGPIAIKGPRGYSLDTHDGTFDLKARTLASGSAVTGTVTQGAFSADRMLADLANRTVTLDGHAHLRIVPHRAR